MTEQTRDILITGASLLGGEPTDIALSGGTIVAIGADARNAVRDPRVIDAEGLIALPGLVDIHTHLRQPGGEDAETVFTGTRAAAVGGYTAVHAMANTTPTQDTAAIVDQVLRLGEEADWVEVRPVGAVTKGLEGKQLASLGSMARSRSKVRVFSDDGTIDCIGTDHAPHPLEMKDCEWQAGAFGMTGLETALPIIIETMVNTGRMDWADVARVMSTVPAQIGRVESQGQGLVVGAPAHVTLVDATVRVTVDPAKQWTRSTNCPFRGMELPGQVRYTIYNGVPTVVDATPIAKEDR